MKLSLSVLMNVIGGCLLFCVLDDTFHSLTWFCNISHRYFRIWSIGHQQLLTLLIRICIHWILFKNGFYTTLTFLRCRLLLSTTLLRSVAEGTSQIWESFTAQYYGEVQSNSGSFLSLTVHRDVLRHAGRFTGTSCLTSIVVCIVTTLTGVHLAT